MKYRVLGRDRVKPSELSEVEIRRQRRAAEELLSVFVKKVYRDKEL